MLRNVIGDLGHFFVILSFISALLSAFSYYWSTRFAGDDLKRRGWIINGRSAFYLHGFAVLGVVATLFIIIYRHYFEYHYAWSHSSLHLPTHYMISCFWEGQEGSFLLWLFWHTILGFVLIATNRFWEPTLMTIFALVQAFLASMILGVVIPGIDLKIGSSPFILLREVFLDEDIFRVDPNFIPEDGRGLNPLLQNYWMVIHPPTLFLGFATTLIPFGYCIAGLWTRKYKEWIRPALPWALFSGAILGLGILMGGYWAYETLSFGGYWNWDPVENAVYVPWLVLIAAIHTMITFRNSSTALKFAMVLVVATFVLILYSTFLTRSGILGDASVHSFTDLGLSGQLLIYLLFFALGSIVLLVTHWRKIPTTEKEVSTYSREFWIFMGAIVLCLMGFQVLLPTSIPVYNSIVESLGGISNIAPPADQVAYYSKFQLWFAVVVALLSGTGQFFWWKRIDKAQLKKELTVPVMLSMIVSALIIAVGRVNEISFIVLLTSGVYTVIANTKILLEVWKSSPKLSGGAVAHIGIGMILVGILFSAGYSKVVSLNTTGLLISRDASEEFNNENLLLFLNEPKFMAGYDIEYKGERLEPRNRRGFIDKNLVRGTSDPIKVVAKEDLYYGNNKLYNARDTLEIYPENTYYEIEYTNKKGRKFSLFPRAQINEDMGGLLASPDIRRGFSRDLYTHVSSVRNPDEPVEWSELQEFEIMQGENFFVNDYVATLENVKRISTVDGVNLGSEDVAIEGTVKVLGEEKEYEAKPIFLIKDRMVGRIPSEVPDLGLKLTLMNVHPEANTFTVGTNTRQKDWVVLKAMEKPYINVLWIGTLVLMLGFGIAINRRYVEFKKMREKGQE